jgi:hypothetical protein
MACWAEYVQYCSAWAAAGVVAGAIVAELGSGVGAGLSIPTALAGIAAVGAVVGTGMAYANCMEQAGKPSEAEQDRCPPGPMPTRTDAHQQLPCGMSLPLWRCPRARAAPSAAPSRGTGNEAENGSRRVAGGADSGRHDVVVDP